MAPIVAIAEIQHFKNRLQHAFPPAAFYGLVSSHDECDEGIDLRQELPGKRWDEVSPAFIDFNSGSLYLLESDAIVAFLPAWLLRSLETLTDENRSVLAEFTMYFLCPGDEEEGWRETRIAALVALFDGAQRSIIADFLKIIAENETLKSWRPYAEFGLKWWAAQKTSAGSEPA